MRKLRLEDHRAMRSWIRLNKDQYNKLLELVMPLIAKSDTRMRKAVMAGEHLILTRHYLATSKI